MRARSPALEASAQLATSRRLRLRPNVYGRHAGVGSLEQIGLDNMSAYIAPLKRRFGRRTRKLCLQNFSQNVGALFVLRLKDVQALVKKLAASNIVCSLMDRGFPSTFTITLDDMEVGYGT